MQNRVDWDYFDKFIPVVEKYMPDRGEGSTMASQIVTAVNKLIYKWYNDGDVFDNTYSLEGWANNLSSYANWLNENVKGLFGILYGIKYCEDEADYDNLLKELADKVLNEEFLVHYERIDAKRTIYDCGGPFRFDDNY